MGRAPPKEFKRECQLPDGRKHGGATEWFENGSVKAHIDWHLNQMHGFLKTWYEDGTPRKSCGYDQGRLDGACETWYPNGTKEGVVTYEAGLRNGTSSFWYDTGVLQEKAEYLEDRLEGTWTEYFPNGKKRFEADYVGGMRDGVWRTFNLQGVTVEQGTYESDWKMGSWVQFYDDGNAKSAGQFKNDQRIGEWVQYYPDGETLKSRGSFVRDREMGHWTYFDKSGNVSQYVEFVDGEQDVSVRVGRQGGTFDVTCADGSELGGDGETLLGWPRVLSSESERIELADLLADSWVYELANNVSAVDEVTRARCLDVACQLTGDPTMCAEISAVKKYLAASLASLVKPVDGAGKDGYPLIAIGELDAPDDASTVPTLAWLATAMPGEQVAFGQEEGGYVALMADEHVFAKNLVPREWSDYRKKLLEPACTAFSEATLTDESVWPEVLSARELWEVSDEMVRTVLAPPSANRDVRISGDMPALNLRASLPDWIRSWPSTRAGADDEVNRDARRHARLLRSVVVFEHLCRCFGGTFCDNVP